jgi:hypothetical protein
MQRTVIVASAVAIALAAAGYAVANGFDGTQSVTAVAATFTATTASNVQTRTCTTADGKTLVSTNGTYTGTSSGSADLTGTATLQARSTINSTDNIGVVSGSLRVDVSSSQSTRAHFDAVYTGGQIAGLATGDGHDSHVKLLGNLSSGFTAAGGFTGGKIGGGTSGGSAVELGQGKCQRSTTVKQTSRADGTVSAVSSTSITVAGLTCSVPASLQSAVAALTVGSRAEIECSLVDNVNTLVRADAKKH